MKNRLWLRIAGFVIPVLLAVPILMLLFLVVSPNYLVLIVRSDSMKPTFQAGDMIVLKSYKEGDIEPGQIIAFEENGCTVTHRAVSVSGGVVMTKGDALQDADPWEITNSQVRGMFIFKIPWLGYVAKFFRSRSGYVLILIGTFFFLVAVTVYEFRHPGKARKGGDRRTSNKLGKHEKQGKGRKLYWV